MSNRSKRLKLDGFPDLTKEALSAILALALAVLACSDATPTPTSVGEATRPASTMTSAPTTEVPTATSTEPTPVETSTPTLAPPLPTSTLNPTPTPPPAPTATPPPQKPKLTIRIFSVDVEDIPTGKRLTFRWETTGASYARIVSGTSHRFPQLWDVPPNGTHTAELSSTLYRNPDMILIAYDDQGNEISQSVTIEWPCPYEYFFRPEPAACPVHEAIFTAAAEQAFENGRMIWLKYIDLEQPSPSSGTIFVLYADGRYEQFNDTWTPDQPESDPAFEPPPGLHQPVRGFGKLWRENSSVREQLDWGLAPEQDFEAAWQRQTQESLPSIVYVRALDDQLIKLYGVGATGNWELIAP